MNGPELRADDPREWLRHARSDLALASSEPAGVLYEALCFHAQQAAEKAIKAVLIARRLQFPYTHDLRELLQILTDVEVPKKVIEATYLTQYAVEARYPNFQTVLEDEYRRALELGRSVVEWAGDHLRTRDD